MPQPEKNQYDGDVPDQDLDEDTPVQPSAPPDVVVPGYEQVAFTNENPVGPPPAYSEDIQDTTVVSRNLPSITAKEAQEALQEYVSQHCCYGSDAARKMDIKDIKSSSAFHYSLETYTEGRSIKWKQVPYSGGFVDGPSNGPAPGPWDIQCNFSQAFKNETIKVEVPHTSTVKKCHACSGKGFRRCISCRGKGKRSCSACSGSGRRKEWGDQNQQSVECVSCNGSGEKRCLMCAGLGRTPCLNCKGKGKLRNFIQLTVVFTNRLEEHIIKRSDMPDHLVRDAEGYMMLKQIETRVGPVVGFFEEEINRQSFSIVQKHATAWPNERILQQRQKLRAVPVSECRFNYKDDEGRFWVYGRNRAVFTKDYPHTCCCCKCVIL